MSDIVEISFARSKVYVSQTFVHTPETIKFRVMGKITDNMGDYYVLHNVEDAQDWEMSQHTLEYYGVFDKVVKILKQKQSK